MTNEELALKIQSGERDLIPELWGQIEKFVRYMADKQLRRLPAAAAVEADDLYDAGYLGFTNAVERFDAGRDTAFTTILTMTLKTAFMEAAGYRSRKQQKDPLFSAVSLEAPLADVDDLCLGDSITDEAAEAAFENAERKMFVGQLREELSAAVGQLSRQQREVLRHHFYRGRALRDIAESMGITAEAVRQHEVRAFRELRRPKYHLAQFAFPDGEGRIDRRTNFYYHVGVNKFHSTGTSDVEEIVMKREEWRDRLLDQETDEIMAGINEEIDRMLQAAPWMRERVEQLRKGGEVNGYEPG